MKLQSTSLLISILLIIVGLINFLPVIGVLSAENLSAAYSIELAGNDIVILMRHRALLFGIIGGFVLFAAFKPGYQVAAMTMAACSMIGFLFLVWSAGEFNQAIAKIAIIDGVGIACLALAAGLRYQMMARQNPHIR